MDILGLDYPCMDFNILCAKAPEKGEWIEMDDASMEGGGKVPNALCAAARLGSSCAIMGTVGEDRFGRACRDDLAAHGVDVSRLLYAPGGSALCVSIVAAGEKRFIEHPRAHRALEATELDADFIGRAKFLLLYQMDETAAEAARIARARGVRVALDADEFDERAIRHMNLIDLLIASEYFYEAVCPECDGYEAGLKKLSALGPSVVIVTLGEKGSAVLENGAFSRVDAFQLDHVVDTTGAGDAFHGALCHYMARGLRAAEAARLSGAVSAVKCLISGGRAGLPDAEMVRRFAETGDIDLAPLLLREERYRRAVWE